MNEAAIWSVRLRREPPGQTGTMMSCRRTAFSFRSFCCGRTVAASWEHLNCRLDPWLSCDLGGNGGSDLMPVLATPDALGWPKGKRKKKKKMPPFCLGWYLTRIMLKLLLKQDPVQRPPPPSQPFLAWIPSASPHGYHLLRATRLLSHCPTTTPACLVT